MFKVVFDTQIYLRAGINPNSVCGQLLAKWTPYYILYLSENMEKEIVDVFTRSKIRAKFPQITNATLAGILKNTCRSRTHRT